MPSSLQAYHSSRLRNIPRVNKGKGIYEFLNLKMNWILTVLRISYEQRLVESRRSRKPQSKQSKRFLSSYIRRPSVEEECLHQNHEGISVNELSKMTLSLDMSTLSSKSMIAPHGSSDHKLDRQKIQGSGLLCR